MAQPLHPKDQVDLQGALRGSVVPLSVKALKKKGVKRVKVIERDRLLKALMQAVEQKLADRPGEGGKAETPGAKKRVELLLIELERVSKAKTQLEHEKALLEELDRVREDRDKTRKSLDLALKEAERRIESECERARAAEGSLAQATTEIAKLNNAKAALEAERT